MIEQAKRKGKIIFLHQRKSYDNHLNNKTITRCDYSKEGIIDPYNQNSLCKKYTIINKHSRKQPPSLGVKEKDYMVSQKGIHDWSPS